MARTTQHNRFGTRRTGDIWPAIWYNSRTMPAISVHLSSWGAAIVLILASGRYLKGKWRIDHAVALKHASRQVLHVTSGVLVFLAATEDLISKPRCGPAGPIVGKEPGLTRS